MDSNFEWQKHQANERIQSAMDEANAHRIAKQLPKTRRKSLFNILKGIFSRSQESAPNEELDEVRDRAHGEYLVDY